MGQGTDNLERHPKRKREFAPSDAIVTRIARDAAAKNRQKARRIKQAERRALIEAHAIENA